MSSSTYDPPPATIAGDIAVTSTLTGAVLTAAEGDAPCVEGDTITLSGTWTTYYNADGAIDNNENAYLDITATGAMGTTTFTSAYANNSGTVALSPPSSQTGYEITDNGATGTGGYNALYLDWLSETPTSLAESLTNGIFTSLLDGNGNIYTLTNEGVVTCFIAGTAITTPTGTAPVENLAIGDLITCADGSTAPIRWIGRREVTTSLAMPMTMFPICIRAGALGDNLPLRDLLVSPAHAMLVDGVLVQAGALVNGSSITRMRPAAETFTYYHLELAAHALILSEGAASESFVDNVDRMGFDNWAEHEALFGNTECLAELRLPRVKSARQLPLTIRNRLAEVAARLYPTSQAA